MTDPRSNRACLTDLMKPVESESPKRAYTTSSSGWASATRYSPRTPARGEVRTVGEPTSPKRLVAIYLGSRTLVFGAGSVTVHPHTRGAVDRNAAIFGAARLKRTPASRRTRTHMRELGAER
jgi:hypothetical protein